MQAEQERLNTNLRTASFWGDLADVKKYVEAGAEINSLGLAGPSACGPPLQGADRAAIIAHHFAAHFAAHIHADAAAYMGKAAPLHYAAFMGRDNVVKFLLEAGADTLLRSEKYKTAIQAAEGGNQSGTAEIIRNFVQRQCQVSQEKNKILENEKAAFERNIQHLQEDNEQLKKKIAQTKSKASSLQHEVVDLTQLLTEKTQLLTTCEKSWNGAMMILPAVSIIFFFAFCRHVEKKTRRSKGAAKKEYESGERKSNI